MVLSEETQVKILQHYRDGLKPPSIAKILQDDGVKASRTAIANFIKDQGRLRGKKVEEEKVSYQKKLGA